MLNSECWEQADFLGLIKQRYDKSAIFTLRFKQF